MLISSILVVIYLLVYIRNVYLQKGNVNPMTGKMISMGLGMMNGLVIGVLAGVFLQSQLALSTVSAVMISLIIAIVIGYPFGIHGMIEAACSSAMGGMMGAMLGEMLRTDEISLMLLFMDFIYVISMAIVLLALHKKNRNETVVPFGKKQSTSLIFSIIIPILVAASVNLVDLNAHPAKQSEEVQQHQHHMP
ncbi:hypothetical protein [Bacillus sp. 1NLA3E]|uniref:hypothetical protein n=1 Tax=Bacillus sp. 1NLA3E TaxID=666686 RepID=UPI000247F140|nr:hypothetical protein [Bacillus sp. 1NLA3E]